MIIMRQTILNFYLRNEVRYVDNHNKENGYQIQSFKPDNFSLIHKCFTFYP